MTISEVDGAPSEARDAVPARGPDGELAHLPSFGDGRGLLVSIEGLSLPFDIRRVYYIIPEQDHPRGFHAHYELQQYMVCVSGSCRVVLDNGVARTEVMLDRPTLALPVDRMTWREMHDWTPGTVLLVLASLPYDEADYIRDYASFVREARADREQAR